jgi:hypothetical protein
VIPQLSPGGGGRAAIATAAAVSQHAEVAHTVASLRPAHPEVAALARSSGIEVLDGSREDLTEPLARADLVHLHFWNSPELAELLERELPAMRLLLWSHVAGHTAPQILLPELVAGADLTVASSESSTASICRARAELGSGDRGVELLPSMSGWERVEGITRSSRPGFNVGYIGTVGSTKLHPEFADMCASVRVSEAQFIVCGTGDAVRRLPHEAAQLGIADRFELRGQVDDIGAVLADLDVFGYPLRPDTYSIGDLALKEAMYAGVPPVVIKDGGSETVVEHGRTGLIAADPSEYSRAIERLYEDPEERLRMGANAREHAERSWGPGAVGPLWAGAYERLLTEPKRQRPPVLRAPRPGDPPGAARFVRGLGAEGTRFQVSMAGSPDAAAAADRSIADSAPQLGLSDGGLLDYARRYPDDALLALWSGLFLSGADHPALATAQLSRALELGCPPARVEPHLSEVAG